MNNYPKSPGGWPYLLIYILMTATIAFTLAGTTSALAKPPLSESLGDAADIENYWDAFFAREMETYGVHGAEMVMVQDGEVVLAKGYGYADAAAGVPFDAEATIVRSGSIAKTLTATAILQLAEQGAIDLDADINQYLTLFKIPDTFPEPVTARHLINMTGGFDTRLVGIRAHSAAEVQPLGEYLAENMPPRVLPPGRYRRYNDHELALAGYLVEAVSGTTYEAYVREHIFQPLQMHDSSVLLPDEQIKRAARGYPVGASANGAYPLNYYYLNTAPGAGFNTTALDVGRYMIAHLQDGAYTRTDGSRVRILTEATARQMHQTAFTYHPRLPGQANSFDEIFHNGHRYLRKSGGAPGMQNHMILLLDQSLGFYLFYNSDGFGLRNRWTEEILGRYLPTPAPSHQPTRSVANIRVNPANYQGIYREVSDQTSETTFVKIQALLDPDLSVRVDARPDGNLGIGRHAYSAVEPDLFKDPESEGYIAFELDERGRATYLFLSRTPFERVSWLETPPVQLGLLGFALVASIYGCLPVLWMPQRRNPRELLPGIVAALNLVFVVGLVWIMLPVATGGDKWQFSLPPSPALRMILALPVLNLLLAAGLLVQLAASWRKAQLKLRDALVLAGTAALLYFLQTWNLLGWRF